MRKFSYYGFAALFFLTACQSNADSSIDWNEAGKVVSSLGKELQLEITGIYDHANFSTDSFLAGFKIDEEGNNIPQIARISNDLSKIKYWSFNVIPNDIFPYQKAIQFVTTDGQVYKMEQDSWNLTQLKFPPESLVVYSDEKEDLVICYPASMEKTVVRKSGCRSLKNDWQLDFVWNTKAPKVCHGMLYILEQNHSTNNLKKVDVTSGKVVYSKLLEDIPSDLCVL